MGKIKDFFKGPHRQLAWFMTVTGLILLFFWIVGPGHTFIHWGRAAVEVHRQEKLIRRYEKENIELDKRIDMMKNDRDTLEKFAREHFNFAVPGEDVYVIEE